MFYVYDEVGAIAEYDTLTRARRVADMHKCVLGSECYTVICL
jgi:hypothetical protein